LRVPFYDIKAQYEELSAPIDAAVHEVISGGTYALGKHHNAFEREIADLHGMKHGIAVNSGTDALRIAMDASGFGPGDEVITTAFTFVASTETIVQTGATPIFVDIDPETYCIDVSKIEAAITPRTRAILPIHLYGQLSDVVAMDEIARDHGLTVIEDAAQALGSHRDGKCAGKWGAAACISFYVTKNLGAAGDGGMILTDDDGLAERSKSMRIHGMGRERYYYDHLGYTSRLAEVQAAFLRVKLTKMAEWNERRAQIAAIYLEGLEGCGLGLPSVSEGNNHTWHQFSVRSSRRDELQAQLKEHGIDSMIYYPVPIHFHEPYRRYGKGEGSLPETERAAREILNLPIHPHLSKEQARHVAETLAQLTRS
jgi:dTDP-4-amino-4,6-dideoxygalactose transaminase